MIRQCNTKDFEVIYSIINEAAKAYRGVIPKDRWKEPYMSKEELQHEIDDDVLFWGYEERGELIGIMGIQNVQDITLIRHSYVRNTKQKQGIGGKLLSFLCGQTTRPVLIGTWADASWAVHFYEKYGFTSVSPEEKDRLLKKILVNSGTSGRNFCSSGKSELVEGGNRLKKKAFIILILSLLLLFSLAQAEKALSVPVPAKSYKFKGALDIRIHPPENKLHPAGELLIVDPLGRKVGTDSRVDKTYTEIPGSSYESESIADAETGAPGPETRIIDIGNPTDGEYILYVMGTEASKYDMEIRGYDCDMNHSHMNFFNIGISEGEKHEYKIIYSSKKGSKIEVIPAQRKTDLEQEVESWKM